MTADVVTNKCISCTQRHLAMGGTPAQLYNRCMTCRIGQMEHMKDHKAWNGHVPSSHK